jgi:hypothetical protein
MAGDEIHRARPAVLRTWMNSLRLMVITPHVVWVRRAGELNFVLPAVSKQDGQSPGGALTPRQLTSCVPALNFMALRWRG